MAEYPGTDGGGWLLGTLDEVEELMRVSCRSDLVVRFRDRGFAEITTAWQWLGEGIGVAHLIVGGAVCQSHLMLAGTAAEQPVARAWLRLAGVLPDTAMLPAPAPALITLEREGYADHAGGYPNSVGIRAWLCLGVSNQIPINDPRHLVDPFGRELGRTSVPEAGSSREYLARIGWRSSHRRHGPGAASSGFPSPTAGHRRRNSP